MAGYGVKEARIDKQRRPTSNLCGGCGEECNGLLCDDCKGTPKLIDEAFPSELPPRLYGQGWD